MGSRRWCTATFARRTRWRSPLRASRRTPTTCARTPDRFGAWLAQIVRNRARNRLAYLRIRRALPLSAADERPAGAASPHADAEREELRRALLAALGGLPSVQREVVMLHDLEGVKHAEIAALVGCSEVMSRRHLSDARRVLRRTLADRYTGDDHDG